MSTTTISKSNFTQKKQIKLEKRECRDRIKNGLREVGGFISDIQLPDFPEPLPTFSNLTAGTITDIFNKQKEMYYNSEYKKLITSLKQHKEKISATTFIAQHEYFKGNENADYDNLLFTREQTLAAYAEVRKTIG